MERLLATGIRDMYGPHFLLLYLAVIVVTLVIAWRLRADGSGSLPPLPVPSKPDPLEVAYLRGGVNEATRFLAFDLLQRGYLQFASDDRLVAADQPPDAAGLSPLEKAALGWFAKPRTAHELFVSELSLDVRGHCRQYRERFETERLLRPAGAMATAALVWLCGALVIAGLGGYKLAAALEKGRHNIGFLIVMGIAALILLVPVCIPARLTRRGKDYLAELHRVFGVLKSRAQHIAAAPDDYTWPLLVGLFGTAALAGTDYAPFARLFRASQAEGGWIGGCGGWAGTGGCGGGGGGCGGGGCGGGGCGGCGG
jgi:uncharacterized protein (TIGR04222 family)